MGKMVISYITISLLFATSKKIADATSYLVQKHSQCSGVAAPVLAVALVALIRTFADTTMLFGQLNGHATHKMPGVLHLSGGVRARLSACCSLGSPSDTIILMGPV